MYQNPGFCQKDILKYTEFMINVIFYCLFQKIMIYSQVKEKKMKKGLFLVFILAMAVAGIGFAQDNTITVDIGPTIVGLGFASAGSSMSSSDNKVNSTGFGIAAQYERQLLEKLSVGGRFAYLDASVGMGNSGAGYSQNYTMNISSFSIEGHVRFYPGANVFFVDGMLGYANLAIGFKGTMSIYEGGSTVSETVSFSVPRNYLKLGAKIGWRFNFGRTSGFVFEPSFGWYQGVGLGDTLGTGLAKTIKNKYNGELTTEDIKDIDDAFKILEQYIFIGGPRLCLSFGWRF